MTSTANPGQHRFVLNNGAGEIPALGFGTLVSDSRETRNATIAAVEVGFRHLDCAARYRNEEEVGAAPKKCSP
jgi:diketogulonate reductase-like aldo/keto reductase